MMGRGAFTASGVLGFVLWTACLPPEQTPQGQQILTGREVRAVPAIWYQDGQPIVAFDVPLAQFPRDQHRGALDLIRPDTLQTRRLAPRWRPEGGAVRMGDMVFLTDDPGALTPSESTLRPHTQIPDLVIQEFTTGDTRDRIPLFVGLAVHPTRFGVFSSGQFYRRLHLGDLSGHTLDMGEIRIFSIVTDGTAYLVRADHDALLRVRAPGQTPELLLNAIDRFVVSADGQYLMIDERGSIDDPLVAVDTQSLQRTELASRAIDCQVNVRHPTLPQVICLGPSEGAPPMARASAPSKARIVELDRKVVRDVDLDAQNSAQYHRFSPDGDVLIIKHGAQVQALHIPSGACTTGLEGGYFWTFTPDGQDILALVEQPAAHAPDTTVTRLVLADRRLRVRAVLSPPSHTVLTFGIMAGTTPNDHWVVYDATTSDHARDLMAVRLSDPDAGPVHLASGVRKFVLGSGRVLALVAVSSQDRTGELRVFDPATGQSDLLGAAVLDFATAPACPTCPSLGPGSLVAFALRTRAPTTMEGLWVHHLP